VQSDLPLGAHLISPRRGYVHHGIHVGNGRVIHYAGYNRALRRGPVEEVSLEAFTRGRPLEVRTHAASRYSPAERVERARSRLGENRYRFWTNNCEHFCSWCVSGTSRSAQVDAWRDRMGSALSAFGMLFGGSRLPRRVAS
jgi:hypothetical protein